jgi:hypothetical protein
MAQKYIKKTEDENEMLKKQNEALKKHLNKRSK